MVPSITPNLCFLFLSQGISKYAIQSSEIMMLSFTIPLVNALYKKLSNIPQLYGISNYVKYIDDVIALAITRMFVSPKNAYIET